MRKCSACVACWVIGLFMVSLVLAQPPQRERAEREQRSTSAARQSDAGRESERRTVPRDPHSFARPEEARVEHVSLQAFVDFDNSLLDAAIVLHVKRNDVDSEGELILDTRQLQIDSVAWASSGAAGSPQPGQRRDRQQRTRWDDASWQEADFQLGQEDTVLGQALKVQLPAGADLVRIEYRTSPESKALQWVQPQGTAGKRHPFLFSQSQAIHARSWLPIQDSPAIRVTYDAVITVRQPRHAVDAPALQAVMSADRIGSRQLEDQMWLFEFDMPQSIPPYLFAIAVGHLEFRELGRRTGVWAEPEIVELAENEFADTEHMLELAERRLGEYDWGRYDIVVLPPSFPFGGMENAKMTFVTPTILVGDRSQVSLIAHELAHSWAGNLVTNATWRDFWLNEGITTYLERRLIEDVFGQQRAAMERALGQRDLREEIQRFKPDDQVLHIQLEGRDPDEGLTRIPYEKGALFLMRLEEAFGREQFDKFLREYFEHFAFSSITTDDFEEFVRERLFAQDPDSAAEIDLDQWLRGPGIPDDAPQTRSDRLVQVERSAERFMSGEISVERIDAEQWSTHEWVKFLRSLPTPLDEQRMAELDRQFKLTESNNGEIAQVWLVLAIESNYEAANDRVAEFLTTIGRRKFLMPIYEALVKTPEGRRRAEEIFQRARTGYHAITEESVERLLRSAAEGTE